MQTPNNTVIDGKTFANMKVHFKSSDKAAIISYANFMNIVNNPMGHVLNGLYTVTYEDGTAAGLINTADILFIEPADPNE